MSQRFTVRQVAQVCHEANRALQTILGEEPNEPWLDCTEDLQDSAVQGVLKAQAGETPEQLHESWMAHRRANGWTYGEIKDVDKKTHPCLVPYSQLPDDQRVKDTLFHSIVTALTAPQSVKEAFDQGRHEQGYL